MGKNYSLLAILFSLNGICKPGGGLVKLGANQGVGRGWIGGGSGNPTCTHVHVCAAYMYLRPHNYITYGCM